MTRRSSSLRILALVGMSALGSVVAAGQTSPLAAAANTPADAAQQRVANIPSTVDAPVVADHLIQAFRNRSSLHRVQLLEQIEASPAIPPETANALLQDALHDQDPLVREAALQALLRRDNVQTPVLNEADLVAFQGENAELAKVHFAARNEDTATLKDLLQHGNAVVQQSAFEALAATDLPGAIEALRTELRDTTSVYRLQTLELLTRSNTAANQLLPLLYEFANDTDPLVRDYARQTLKEQQKEAAEK
jgi:HEAT repeat protein